MSLSDWRTRGPLSITADGLIQGAKGEPIARLVSPSLLAGSLLEWQANAEYIVRAVNNHEALLSALRDLSEHHQCSQCQEAARQAIAQAESK